MNNRDVIITAFANGNIETVRTAFGDLFTQDTTSIDIETCIEKMLCAMLFSE